MLERLPALDNVVFAPDRVVSIIESINTPQVSIPGIAAEATRAYVVGARGDGGFVVYVLLHLAQSNLLIAYGRAGDGVAVDGFHSLEAEGIRFCEDMGFMLDNLGFRGLVAADRQRLIDKLPFFGVGAQPPRDLAAAIDAAPSATIPGEPAGNTGVMPQPISAIDSAVAQSPVAHNDDDAPVLARLLASF